MGTLVNSLRTSVLVLLALAGLVLSGCSSTSDIISEPAPANYGGPSASPNLNSAGGYTLSPGDKISVNVFGENNLSGEFIVSDDGNIDFPLIGAVQAQGQTVDQLQQQMVFRYSQGYLKDPKIAVSVLNYRPFFITGEVGKGGEYPYKAGITVQDAVAMAGGYSYRANTGKVFIRRAGADKEVEVPLDQRVQIQPGDIVRVPERFF